MKIREISLFFIGASLSVIWLFVLFYLYKYHWTPCVFSKLTPNELGDLLAGWFAPLAFLWLAIAVFLQKFELQAQRSELALTRILMEDQRSIVNVRNHFEDLACLCMQIFKLIIEQELSLQFRIDQSIRDETQSLFANGNYGEVIQLATRRFSIASTSFNQQEISENSIGSIIKSLSAIHESALRLSENIDDNKKSKHLFISMKLSAFNLSEEVTKLKKVIEAPA